MKLQNDRVGVTFDPHAGTLCALHNRITGERFTVRGDDFVIDLLDRQVSRADCVLASVDVDPPVMRVAYEGKDLRVVVEYRLAEGWHFIEKTLSYSSAMDHALRKITLARLSFHGEERLDHFTYRYQKNVTFFARTGRGGLFTGVELADDASYCDGMTICLAYCPNLKWPAGAALESEPMYLGVYARADGEGDVQFAGDTRECVPLPSESQAMIAIATALLDQPAQDLATMPILWNSRLGHQDKLTSSDQLAQDQRVFDYLKECGFAWSHEFNPWGGEFARLNALRGDEPFDYDPMQKQLLDHGRQQGFQLVLWATMTNAHPWRGGSAFRPDRPEWLTSPLRYRFLHAAANTAEDDARSWRDIQGNCMANAPFVDWIEQIIRGRLDSGLYDGFSLDGDFVGVGGLTALGCPCQRDDHDHLPGEGNYACQRAVTGMLRRIRRDYPRCYIWLMRPMMDLGIWSTRYGSCVFTLDEFSRLEGLPRLKDQPTNVICGDKIRLWSRVRLHRHFLPHYLDQPLVFPYTGSRVPGALPWSADKIDYIMLSALSCSPNQAYYLPPAEDMPAADRAQLHKWLDWGRSHINYLFVRRDLPAWPKAGSVDGSAHIIDDRGFIFLFNPNKQTIDAVFDVTPACLGIRRPGGYVINQQHPPADRRRVAHCGECVHWPVEGESTVILEIKPAE